MVQEMQDEFQEQVSELKMLAEEAAKNELIIESEKGRFTY